jgi:hypothetical protein
VVYLRHQYKLPPCGGGLETSTVIVRGDGKGTELVSDETVMHGYESSATLTTDGLHYKLQTSTLVRECAPRGRAKQLPGKRKEKEKSGHGPQGGARHQDG